MMLCVIYPSKRSRDWLETRTSTSPTYVPEADWLVPVPLVPVTINPPWKILEGESAPISFSIQEGKHMEVNTDE